VINRDVHVAKCAGEAETRARRRASPMDDAPAETV
jgi:hypothetical protein